MTTQIVKDVAPIRPEPAVVAATGMPSTWQFRWKRVVIVSEQAKLPDYSTLRIRDNGDAGELVRLVPGVQSYTRIAESVRATQDERMDALRAEAQKYFDMNYRRQPQAEVPRV